MTSGNRVVEPGTGREVVKWDPKVSIEICEDVAEGKSLKEVTGKERGRISAAVFLRWCLTVPELGAVYKLAREISGHMLEDEALGHARKLSAMDNPSAGKVRALDVAMGQLRWSAGKRNPREYSEKSSISFTVPIQINTSLPLNPGDDMTGEDQNAAFIIDLKAEPPPAELESGPPARTFYDAAREGGKTVGKGSGKGSGKRALKGKAWPGGATGGRAAIGLYNAKRRAAKEAKDAEEAAEGATRSVHRGPLDRRKVGEQVAPVEWGGVQGAVPGPGKDQGVAGEGDGGSVVTRGDHFPGGRVGGGSDGHKRDHHDPEGVDNPVGEAGDDVRDPVDGVEK